jgi:hypothetical protein
MNKVFQKKVCNGNEKALPCQCCDASSERMNRQARAVNARECGSANVFLVNFSSHDRFLRLDLDDRTRGSRGFEGEERVVNRNANRTSNVSSVVGDEFSKLNLGPLCGDHSESYVRVMCEKWQSRIDGPRALATDNDEKVGHSVLL